MAVKRVAVGSNPTKDNTLYVPKNVVRCLGVLCVPFIFFLSVSRMFVNSPARQEYS